MPKVMRNIVLSSFISCSLLGCHQTSGTTPQHISLEVDEVVRSELGVGLVATSLLITSGETVFFRSDSMTNSEKAALDELRESGLASITEVGTIEGPFIRIVPSERGEEIRTTLNPR